MRGARRLALLLHGRTLETSAGATRVVMPRPGRFPSFYVFALHKGGSSLMNIMLVSALDYAKVPHIGMSEWAFAAGLPENEITNADEFIFPRGYCYRGYRQFPPYLRSFDIAQNKKVLLVRDPRDIIVSDYFSTRYSHAIPAQGSVRDELLKLRDLADNSGIDDYCLSQAPFYRSEFDGYRHIEATELRLYRYEDVIFNKQSWLEDMLSYFDISVPSSVIESIAEANDIRPEQERPTEHIRNVFPANFRLHLKQATIDMINQEFHDVLSRYGYAA